MPRLYVRLSDEGIDVEQIQADLNLLGCNIVQDGKFGNQTETAVKKVQEANNIVIDGVVGPQVRMMFRIIFLGRSIRMCCPNIDR